MADTVIEVRGLAKRYGDVEAVRGIDLRVQRGQVFAFLGPNGAGKTTTTEILEGFRRRDGGEVTVLGEDPGRPRRAWRERIGIVLQSLEPDPYLTVREALTLFAGYYRSPRPVEEVVDLIGLREKADARARDLSGGQQRRLDVGMALVGDPELLFLDEPTTGFDPSARRAAWEVIAGLRDLGVTVFLTTHYMDEAQRLADRVAIISRGRIVAEGKPAELGDRESQPARVSFRVPDGTGLDGLPAPAARSVNGSVSFETSEPTRDLNRLTAWALDRGVALEGLEVRRPSLEDVYLQLTGEEPDL